MRVVGRMGARFVLLLSVVMVVGCVRSCLHPQNSKKDAVISRLHFFPRVFSSHKLPFHLAALATSSATNPLNHTCNSFAPSSPSTISISSPTSTFPPLHLLSAMPAAFSHVSTSNMPSLSANANAPSFVYANTCIELASLKFLSFGSTIISSTSPSRSLMTTTRAAVYVVDRGMLAARRASRAACKRCGSGGRAEADWSGGAALGVKEGERRIWSVSWMRERGWMCVRMMERRVLWMRRSR